MARKKKHEEHENHERWLVSYADFITLLFAFFVVMYSVSSVNEGKYRVLSDALMASFRSSAKTLTPIQLGKTAKSPETHNLTFRNTPALLRAANLPMPDVGIRKKGLGAGIDPLGEMADEVEDALSRLIDEDLIAVRRDDTFVEIEVNSSILFPAGGAKLTDDAKRILADLAKILRNFPNFIRVEGHTDAEPISTVIYPSNWELSSARAASVVRLFAEQGVLAHQMSSVGYAQYRPIADNETPEGRIRNRRVAVVILGENDPYALRENLYLASVSEDGKPDVDRYLGRKKAYQPVDITDQEGVVQRVFPVIQPPVQLLPPVRLDLAPALPESTDSELLGLNKGEGGNNQ